MPKKSNLLKKHINWFNLIKAEWKKSSGGQLISWLKYNYLVGTLYTLAHCSQQIIKDQNETNDDASF